MNRIEKRFMVYYADGVEHNEIESFDTLEEAIDYVNLKSASNLNGNLNCSKELEHYAS